MPENQLFLTLQTTSMPPHDKLRPRPFKRFPEGAIVLEGAVGMALDGVFCQSNTGYLLTDEGYVWWDTHAFRGLTHGKRVQIIKESDQLVVKPIHSA